MANNVSHAVSRSAALCGRRVYRQRSQARTFLSSSHQFADTSHLPRVAQPSLWTSLIPKAFRRSDDPVEAAERARVRAARPKEWNPYTVFIVLGLIVGSNAINLIALRREMVNFSRKTDAKLELLREVVQRVRNGENVDVEGLLGTGDPKQEQEWEDVLKELENAETLTDSKRRKEERRTKRGLERDRREAAHKNAQSDERKGGNAEQSRLSDASDDASARRPKFIM